MEGSLPVWAQPHRFWQLPEQQLARHVFTFGLVMPDLRLLRAAEGVRMFGERWGYEWLPELSAGVHQELRLPVERSGLELFLRDAHGLATSTTLNRIPADPAGPPSDTLLAEFADSHGALISEWSLNAFNMMEVRINSWARTRERVERGHEHAAVRRLKLTAMPRRLVVVHTIEGRQRWAAEYTTLYQRVALELEDLAVRRPRLQRCPLCQRAFVPIRKHQNVCATSIWDQGSRKLVARCVPDMSQQTVEQAASVIHARERKAHWARMNRVHRKYGHGHERTKQAELKWAAWQKANPPPRPRGRPPAPTPLDDLPAPTTEAS